MRIILVLLLCVSAVALAQPSRAPVTATASADAWKLYDEAFADAVAGKETDALAMLAYLRSEHPGSAAAALGAELERFLAAKRTGKLTLMDPLSRQLLTERLEAPAPLPGAVANAPAPGELSRDEQPSSMARAELTFWQTIDGVGLGIELCALVECNDARPEILSAMAGGGLGAGLALYLSRDGIKPGQTLALDSGAGWGFWNGLALSQIFELQGRAVPAVLMGAQLGGLALGHLAWMAFPVGSGDVSLANSGGIWGGVVAAFVLNAAAPNATSKGVYITLLAASDVGLIGGALLSRVYPMSRGRTLVLDSGGLLGMLFGLGVDVLAQGDQVGKTPFYVAGAVGTVVGIGGAAYLTRHWDLPAPPVQLGFAPTQGGAMLTASAAL